MLLVVPRAAVREDGGKHYVFVFDGEKLHRREISVGIASASKYEVLSGLTLNDRVALPGRSKFAGRHGIRHCGGNLDCGALNMHG